MRILMAIMMMVSLIVGVGLIRGELPPRTRTLSVCDVLSDDPTKLNGKVVMVRGRLVGNDEGIWLNAVCSTHLITKGVHWDNYLSVFVDAADESIERSWEAMGRAARRQGQRPQDTVWVTIEGRLETRATMDDEIVQTPHGLAKAGFGHLSAAPAEINVIAVQNVLVGRNRDTKEPPHDH